MVVNYVWSLRAKEVLKRAVSGQVCSTHFKFVLLLNSFKTVTDNSDQDTLEPVYVLQRIYDMAVLQLGLFKSPLRIYSP